MAKSTRLITAATGTGVVSGARPPGLFRVQKTKPRRIITRIHEVVEPPSGGGGTGQVLYAGSSKHATYAFQSTLTIPVPAGAATDSIAIAILDRWENITPAVTAPSGFTSAGEFLLGTSGSINKCSVWWKRLTGTDTGNYVFSWSGSMWSTGHALMVTGGIKTGDPIGAFIAENDSGVSSTTSIPSVSVSPDYSGGLLGWHGYSDTTGTLTTTPSGITIVQTQDVEVTGYRELSAAGSYTVSGGVWSASAPTQAVLFAIKPEPAAPPATNPFIGWGWGVNA